MKLPSISAAPGGRAVLVFGIVVGGLVVGAACSASGGGPGNRVSQPKPNLDASQPAHEQSLVARVKRVLEKATDQYRGAPPNATEAVASRQTVAQSGGVGGGPAADSTEAIPLDSALLEEVERRFKALQTEAASRPAGGENVQTNDATRRPTKSKTQAYYATDAPPPSSPQSNAARRSVGPGSSQALPGRPATVGSAPFNQFGGSRNPLGMPLQPGQSLEQLNQFLSANLQAGNELTKHLNMAALRLLAKKGGDPNSATATQLITLYEVMALGQDAAKSWKEGGTLHKAEGVARILIAMAILFESRKDFINKNMPLAGNLYAMQSVINERSQIQQAILNTQIASSTASPGTVNAMQTLQAAYNTQQRSFDNWLGQSQLDRGRVVDYAIKTAVGTGPQAAAAVMRGALTTDRDATVQALRNLPGMSSPRLTALQAQSSNLVQPVRMQVSPAAFQAQAMQSSPQTSPSQPGAQSSAGAYNQLPPAERTEVGKGGAGAGTITVSNQTDYRMEISFSGPSNEQAVIPPHGSRTLLLSEGDYQINARLPERPLVRPFQGTDYYRSTERYALPLYLVSQSRR